MEETTSSNTAPKQRGKPFTKGDKRINRKGRPKSFDQLRALAQSIANEDTGTMTRAELILRAWSLSDNPLLQIRFMEIAYGKVPDKTEISGPDGGGITIRIVDSDDGNDN